MLTPGSNTGNLNGTTAVELVPAPGAGVVRTILSLRIFNADNAVVTATLRKKISGTNYALDYRDSLPVNETWFPIDADNKVMLTATTQSLTAILAGAKSTADPSFEVCWIDRA
jgi:hypothetical protein